MTALSVQSPKDLVVFCDLSLNPNFMNTLIPTNEYGGLSGFQLEELLNQEQYHSVLTSIWEEPNKQRVVNWLRLKCENLHAILFFELAVAEFLTSPQIETIYSLSIPLLKAGEFRVHQDSQCADDLSVSCGDAATRLVATYTEKLNRLVKKHLNVSFEELIQNLSIEQLNPIKEKILQTARLSLTTKLPSPTWVGWHGLQAIIRDTPKMHSEAEHKQLREKYALAVIQHLNLS